MGCSSSGSNSVVFNSLSASVICSVKRGSLWLEWPNKKDTTVSVMCPDKKDGILVSVAL
jgi:hypothetical protein